MEKTSRHRRCIKYRDITDNVLYVGTCECMEFDKKDTDSHHVVAESERIDLLAYRYYGDSSLWWVIADANDIANPLRLYAGQHLRIPAKSTVYRSVNST